MSEARVAPPDRKSIEALIAQNYAGLRLLVARRAGDPHLGADLLQEAVGTAWEKWQRGEIARPEQIAGYVFQVAMNLLRNHRRGVQDRPERRASSEALESATDEADARDEWLEERMALRVRDVLGRIAVPRDREILKRFYLDEEPKESICRDLGLDALQFDKVLHRARGRLREMLASYGLQRSDFFLLTLFM